MSVAEECLICLVNKEWIKLKNIVSDNHMALELTDSPQFSIFENNFVDELKRHETNGDEDFHLAAKRVFEIHCQKDSTFTLSDSGLKKLVLYLFEQDPQEKYAVILEDYPEAIEFLKNYNQDVQSTIESTRIRANLNITSGGAGECSFAKEVFNNSPQEKELFISARKVFPNSILLPNTALSTIINTKVCEKLDQSTTKFFYMSTLDLCVVNPQNYIADLFIELDSSWHDKPKSIENDRKKDTIFRVAGLTLHRLRKRENKEMTEIFELILKKLRDQT